MKCRKLPVKMIPREREGERKKNLKCALFLLVICYTLQNPVNISKDILTMNLAFIFLGERKGYLTQNDQLWWTQSKVASAILWCSACFLQSLQAILLLLWYLFFHPTSFLFSSSLLSLITVTAHGLLSLKIICCLVYLPCTWFIHSCSSVS